MSIARKSLGVLIDELFTTNIKLWFSQEIVMNSDGDIVVAKAAKQAQALNARRNKLIQAIDEIADIEGISPTEKTYG